ncbi:hypothetical protein CWE13_02980 [Aliidiomarina shirensis]|uniref:Uncharacterized protein n=1 Tax=Aliidiomarina shirensis TaxID=1048642 RepID=A0A432WXW6_9GAMM|nr:hypothetical protein CWE13_02980 [Aliidiomarina shirensis]
MNFSEDRILKNRIYAYIAFSFVVFFGAIRLLEPYEERFVDLSGIWLVLGVLFLYCISLLLEYLTYKVLNKYLYKR